jgi:hypothetical protein
MPILSGLVFAASMATTMQDDLINDKHYVVVKNSEQGLTSTNGSSPTQSGAFGSSSQTTGVPLLKEIPVVGQLFTQPAEAPRAPQFPMVFAPNQLAGIAEFKKLVSCSFVDASAGDVLKWLSRQGVNFAGASDSMPKGKLSLNLKDVPLHEALEAIADVFDGNWNLRGKTLVFRAGRSFAFSTSNGPARASFGTRVDPKRPYQLMVPPAQFEMHDLKTNERAIKELAQLHERRETITKEELAKVHEEMKKVHELTRRKDGGAKVTDEDNAKLMKSLTDKQWDLHKKQGFLKFSDLTREQLKLIKADGPIDVNITISYSKDGKSLTLKN